MSALVTTEPKSDLGNELEVLRLRLLEQRRELSEYRTPTVWELQSYLMQTQTLMEELLHHLIIKEIL